MSLVRYQAFAVAVAVAMATVGASAGQAGSPPAVGIVIAQQTYVDVVNMLEKSGYRVLEMKSTFLGRIRIRAANREHVREVVVSRTTGEIKRDQVIQVLRISGDGTSAQGGSAQGSSDQSSSSGSGGGLSASVGSTSASIGSSGVSASTGGGSVSVGGGGIGLGN